MNHSLEFEKPITELERKIEELQRFSARENIDVSEEIKHLQQKSDKIRKEIYENLSAWQRVQIARHPKRPYLLDYVDLLMSDFLELHGDRLFADDHALIGGIATFEDREVMVVGHQKGKDTKENIRRNFGMAHPEGYRKALRLMHLAEKLSIPVMCFIDTSGAYPGVGAEERGIAQAIAVNLMEMISIKVPIIVTVIGEGGSGGAIGIGVGDKIIILENSYYSVISPEGCASILWRDRAKTPEAAESLKLSAFDLKSLGIVDEIVPEPMGGAHRNYEVTGCNLGKVLKAQIVKLEQMSVEDLLEKRYEKFRSIGVFLEEKTTKKVQSEGKQENKQ